LSEDLLKRSAQAQVEVRYPARGMSKYAFVLRKPYFFRELYYSEFVGLISTFSWELAG
jgi:hypothetical protein